MVLRLFPVSGPADHHSVVLQTSQSSNLDQVGRPVSQIGGDDHLREALHLLGLHQLPQRLPINRERRRLLELCDVIDMCLYHSGEPDVRDERTDLICPLGLSVVVEECSLDWGANDGQTLPCFQLIGQRDQARLFYVLLSIHTHQNQDLRPDFKKNIAPKMLCFRFNI